jgi:outer membrane protein assembly factor BamA
MGVLSTILSGCVGTKQFKEGKYVLYKQKTIAPKAINKEELNLQFAQSKNRRLLGLPIFYYAAIYNFGSKRFDSSKYELKKIKINDRYQAKIARHEGQLYKINKLKSKRTIKLSKQDKTINEGNLFMRWGEPLIYLDSALAEKSVESINNYVVSKGWFNGSTSYEVNYFRQRAYVTYPIAPNTPYKIDSVYYDINDARVDSLVSIRVNKQLKAGDQYDQSNLIRERDDIEIYLKNKGYFNFTKQYIQYQIDTTLGENKIAINLSILLPQKELSHRYFELDSVVFTTDASLQNTASSNRSTDPYKGVTYRYIEPNYSKKVLDRRIFIKPGLLYSKENTLATQRELANMDIFKFVNISYDTTGGEFVANIFTSPLPKYQFSSETGLSITSYGLPGPFVSVSLKKRNIFKKLGIFEIDGRIGVEGVAAASDQDQVYSNTESGANVGLTFPQFFLPLSEDMKLKLRLFDPKTKIQFGVTYNRRPEFQRTILNATNSYAWKINKNRQFNFKLIDINLVRTPFISNDYLNRLLELDSLGNNLINSFEDALVSSFSLSYTSVNNYYGQGGIGKYFGTTIEPGGTFNSIWTSSNIVNNDSLQLYSYLRVHLDYRQVTPKSRKGKLAYKIKVGAAIPYGENGVLPYEKYFFGGGSTSIRAWKPRRLGPGAYDHIDESGQVSYQFEQQGEILLETSLEYRQKIIGILQGATFLDAGNIWTINEEPSRPGSQFKIDTFVRQIALGGGIGLRFDFSFLLIRFDAAVKIVDPARPLGSRFILESGFYDPPFDNRRRTEPVVYHFAIGYPF